MRKARLGGLIIMDLGDKAMIARIVRVFDENGNLVRFMLKGVELDKTPGKPAEEAVKGREKEVADHIAKALRSEGVEVVE